MDFIVTNLKCSNNLHILIYKAELYTWLYFVNILTYIWHLTNITSAEW